MRAFLMYPDRDVDLEPQLPPNQADLTQDLELNTLFDGMSQGDTFLADMASRTVLTGLRDPELIRYRQDVLADCLAQPEIVRSIYGIAVELLEGERHFHRSVFNYPDAVLRRSVKVLEFFVGTLTRLRELAEEHADKFRSEGFTELFRMLAKELDDDYFHTVADHLRRLKFRGGVLISAELGKGNKGSDYLLRAPRQDERNWVRRIAAKGPPSYSFVISDRDEAGATALSELRDKGVNLVANALAQSTDHILSFFTMLRAELAFYVGCLNLGERLAEQGEPTCFPVVLPAGRPELACGGLYDVCLALKVADRVVGNDVTAPDTSLVVVTGANEGGKSTFLRSVGLAQLMAQAGMFVGATSFRATVCDGVFTHYRREEDATMRSGKLDEELHRMSTIVDQITPNCLMLFNESFAATNEREGSEIARNIIAALINSGVRVFCVTHLFDLAHGFYRRQSDTALFLQAERQADGRRTFHVIEGEPSPTSHGEDLYQQVFQTTGDDH